ITGIVREAGSGNPIAGVEIRVPRNTRSLSSPPIFTKTDENGKYTLAGLPHGTHRLDVAPPDKTPYVQTTVRVDSLQGGFEPTEFNIEMRRQPAIAGKVVDAVSGQPVSGYVDYHPLVSNKNAANHINLSERGRSNHGLTASIDADGHFFLP